MATKIQINSLQALERLIGGDSEVEIEIRNNIVQEFTKRYLKSLVATPEIQSITDIALQQIRDEASKSFGEYKYQGFTRSFVWNKSVDAQIQETIINPTHKRFISETRHYIDEKSNELFEKLKPEIDNYLSNIIFLKVREQVELSIANQLDTIIQEILHVIPTSVPKSP